MAHKVVTPVETEVVSLAEARLQCKLDSDDTTWDATLTALITAAREYAEHETQRALAPQTLEMALDRFPACGGEILLEMPPISSVTSIKYDDTGGVEQTLATSVYAFSAYGTARRVSLKYGQVWPSTLCQADAVRIHYVTGYDECPKAAKAAMLLHIEAEFPNNALTPDERADKCRARDALLDTIKVWGF
jgi:uncharacterized phiE125 gp8 family phage protein